MKHFFLFFLISASCSYYAQQNTVSAGGDASGSGGTVSFSVGQIDYINSSSVTGELNQGVQQPYELFLVSLDESITETISIHPNPFSNQIILNVSEGKDLSYKLIDASGRLVIKGQCKGPQTTVDVSPLPSGTYQMVLFNVDQQILVYKLIKN